MAQAEVQQQDSPAVVTFMTTEHFVLQTARWQPPAIIVAPRPSGAVVPVGDWRVHAEQEPVGMVAGPSGASGRPCRGGRTGYGQYRVQI